MNRDMDKYMGKIPIEVTVEKYWAELRDWLKGYNGSGSLDIPVRREYWLLLGESTMR